MLGTILAGSAVGGTLGAIFDQVFITAEQRKNISTYLATRDDGLSPDKRFSHFLTRAHALIFERFFSGSFVSSRFFSSAAIISLASFFLVLTIQAVLFPEQFASFQPSFIQVSIFVAFISFNIIFDYATIVQTKIFLDASIAGKTIFRSVVFVMADLIVTINLFIFLYAFFILVVVQFFISSEKEVKIVSPTVHSVSEASETASDGLVSRYGAVSVFDTLTYSGAYLGIILNNDDDDDPRFIYLPFNSSFDINESDFDFNRVFTSISNLNISQIGSSTIESDITRPDIVDLYRESESDFLRTLQLSRDGADEDDSTVEEVVISTFSVDASVMGRLSAAYTVAFQTTDILENTFPGSVTSPMALEGLRDFVATVSANRIGERPLFLCIVGGQAVFRSNIDGIVLDIDSDCDEIIIFETLWLSVIDTDLIATGRNLDGMFVPFNTLFITSVLPTMFFYAALALLFVAVIIHAVLIRYTNKARVYFLRAPLAVSGLLLGAVLAAIGVI